jgi:hypothetical protein
MARSVSIPCNATEIAYQDVSEHDRETFQWFLDDIRDHARSLWPSLRDCDTWLGREDHAILENDLCYLGVSEYLGLASVWLVPKDYPDSGYVGGHAYIYPLAVNWISRIAPTFHRAFGQYRRIGTFSNGESVYERIEWQSPAKATGGAS